jgi:hypothetical protein
MTEQHAHVELTDNPDMVILAVPIPRWNGWAGKEFLPIYRRDLSPRSIERALRDVGWSLSRSKPEANRAFRGFRDLETKAKAFIP